MRRNTRKRRRAGKGTAMITGDMPDSLHGSVVLDDTVQDNQEIPELKIFLKDSKDYRFRSFYTTGSIRNMAHINRPVRIKDQGSDEVTAGTDIKADTKR